MQRNPDDPGSVKKKKPKQLWCCSKVTPGHKLIAVNLGGVGGGFFFFFSFYILLPAESIKQATNAKFNSPLPKEWGNVTCVYF